MIWLKILVFIVSLVLGLSFLIYAEPIVRTFGKTEWAERYLGTQGGTYLVWKIVGIIIIIVGFLFLVGSLDWLFFPNR